MTNLNLSPSLAETLGLTLIHSIWIGFLMLALMKLILYGISPGKARLRYRVAGTSLFLYTGAVAGLFFSLYGAPPARLAGGPAIMDSWQMIGGSVASAENQSWSYPSVWNLVSYLYLSGFIWMMVRNSFALLHLQRLKRTGYAAGVHWTKKVAELARRIGIRRPVKLLESNRVGTPAVFGWLKPVIIVPAGMLTQMPLKQLETIMMHELYHLRRYDYLVNLLQIAAEALFFYHPAVWMISRTMRAEREHCCDDLVLLSCNPPLIYARALAGLSHHQTRLTKLVTAAGGTGRPAMLTRISRILNQQQMKTNMRERLLTLGLFFAGLAMMIVLNGFSSGISIVKHHNTDPLLAIMTDTIPTVPSPATVQDQEEMEMDADVESDVQMEMEQEIESHIDQDIDVEIEKEVQQALDEIDWDKIRAEAEQAAREASESIDWETMTEEMKKAQQEVLEEIDWDQMKKEVEQAKKEALEEIDWDQMKLDIERSLAEIDWDQMRQEIQQSMEEIDWDQIRRDVQRSMEEIDWDQIRRDMERVKARTGVSGQDIAGDSE